MALKNDMDAADIKGVSGMAPLEKVKRFLIVCAALCLVWGKDSWAQAYNRQPLSCPNYFVGMVVGTATPKTPFNSEEKVFIYFEVLKRVRGNSGIAPLIKVEVQREYEFISGETYLIGLKDKVICSIRQLLN